MHATRSESAFLRPVSTARWGGRATRAEINLDAVAHNVRTMRELAGDAHLLVVVKANAYGHGSVPVARTALEHGATWLGVYTVDEAVTLRAANVTAPVLIFGPFQPGETRVIWDLDLTPTVIELASAEALQASSSGGKLRYHLKVDTGLTRNGAAPDEVVPLVRAISSLPALQLEGVFTHFARADEPLNDATTMQIAVFDDVIEHLRVDGFPVPIKHVANSGAALELRDQYRDMIRCGITTYGYAPSADVGQSVALQPALSLLSAVSRVHTALAGTGVGYGHEHRCSRDTRIALVPLGYADGLPRSFGNGAGTALIGGQRVSSIGRVSMDQVTLDVTDVPEVYPGDEVVIIGRQDDGVHTASELGRETGTIDYDILCRITPRVPRLYTRKSQVVGKIVPGPSGYGEYRSQ